MKRRRIKEFWIKLNIIIDFLLQGLLLLLKLIMLGGGGEAFVGKQAFVSKPASPAHESSGLFALYPVDGAAAGAASVSFSSYSCSYAA